MRSSLLSTGLASLLVLATPSASHASPVAAPASSARADTAKLLDYLFTLLMLREKMVEETRLQTAGEPELQALMLEVLQRPDVVPRLSDAFAKLTTVPAESMPYCLAFIRSDTAKAALGVAAKLQSNAQLMQALEALPASQLAELGKFMESPCAQAPVAAMTSDAGQALSYRFGSDLVCEYVQRERPEKMGYMRANGKCLAAP